VAHPTKVSNPRIELLRMVVLIGVSVPPNGPQQRPRSNGMICKQDILAGSPACGR